MVEPFSPLVPPPWQSKSPSVKPKPPEPPGLIPAHASSLEVPSFTPMIAPPWQLKPIEPGNIDLSKRPAVPNPDGTVSTVRSISIGTDKGEVLIPTIADDGRSLADEEAVQLFQKSGKHFGVFKTPQAATAYAQRLHQEEEKRVAASRVPQTDDPQLAAHIAAIQARNPQDFAKKLAEDRKRGLTDQQILAKIQAGMKAVPVQLPQGGMPTLSVPEVPTTAFEDVAQSLARGAASVKGSLGGLLEREGRKLELPEEEKILPPAEQQAMEKLKAIYSVGTPGVAAPVVAAAAEAPYRVLIEEPIAKPLIEKGQKIQKEARQQAEMYPRPAYAEDFWKGMKTDRVKTLAVLGAENLPNLVVTMGASAVHPTLGMAAAWAQETGAAYQEAKESGATEEEAQRISGWVGTTNMFLEYLPAGRLLRQMKGGTEAAKKTLLRELLKQAVSEGGAETVQEANQMLTQALVLGQDLEFKEFAARATEAGLVGLVLGGGAGAVGGVIGQSQREAARQPETPAMGPERFADLNAALAEERAVTGTPAEAPTPEQNISVSRETLPEAAAPPPAEATKPSVLSRARAAVADVIAPERTAEITRLQTELESERQERRAAERAADVDPLTGVANRRALDRALPVAEADPDTAVVVFDANNFGQVNKLVSQEAGDAMLQEIVGAVRTAAEEAGVGERVFRRGGDEVVALAPAAVADQVRSRAEEIFGERSVGPEDKPVTVSLSGTVGQTFAEADAILQERKKARKAAAAQAPAAQLPAVAPPPPREIGGPAAPPVASFRTALGSEYAVLPDGTTVRNKAPRPGHADSGPQPRSVRTFYVTSEDGKTLGEIQTQGGPQRTIQVSGDQAGIRYEEGPSAGKVERRTVVPIVSTPRVGLLPAEIWEDGRVHFGNPITEIGAAALPIAAQEPAPAPPAAPPPADRPAATLTLADRLGRRPRVPEIQQELGVSQAEAQRLWAATKTWKPRPLPKEAVREEAQGPQEADAQETLPDEALTEVPREEAAQEAKEAQAPPVRVLESATAPQEVARTPEAPPARGEEFVPMVAPPWKAQPAAVAIPAHRLAERLETRIAGADATALTSAELFKLADEAFDGTQAQAAYSPKDATDALELAVNLTIANRPESYGAGRGVTPEQAASRAESLSGLIDRLPTQTRRTGESESFQQFSTPPPLGYAVNYAANIGPEDIVEEPSAGTGSLAAIAKVSGAREVHANELAERRAALLKHPRLGLASVTQENAEQISNTLKGKVSPTVVVMNPPFSQTAGRMGDKKSLMTGARHIEQGLELLAPGGRLVALVGGGREGQGGGMRMTAPAYRPWWSKIRKGYTVRANIGIPGAVYRKYGTSFPTRLLVIDKVGPTVDPVLEVDASSLPEALRLLEEVRNVRQQPEGSQLDEQAAPVSRSGKAPEERGGAGRGRRPAREATGPVGPGPVVTPQRLGDEGAAAPNVGARPEAGVPVLPRPRVRERPESGEGAGEVPGGGRPEEGRGDLAGEPAGPSGEAVPTTAEPGVAVKQTQSVKAKGEISDALYEPYTPQRLSIPGAKAHPGSLVQSAAMAAVEPPAPTYTPKLPERLVKTGALSLAQMEAVVYAGQAHEQKLPDGSRRGFSVGDGTGTGKGRELAGIILDNFRQGRKKAIWVSEKWTLLEDAQRDWLDLGGAKDDLISLKKVRAGEPIQAASGIVFATYDTLKQTPKGEAKKGEPTRIDQIAAWLGKDFDGVIALDEAHNLGNSLEEKGKRGKKEASKKALAGIELQRRLPNARVVYVSATMASDVSNLAFADRLGLWGEGTPFANRQAFVDQISSGGVAAMELVARDLKALGSYIARGLSFSDGTPEGTVQYEKLEHALSKDQREIYDKLAEAWQVVLSNMDEALKLVAEKENGKVDGKAKSQAMSAFWGSHQRFFNQVLTAMQMPSVVRAVEKDLADGNSVVLQLVNTNEASQNRQLAKLAEEEDLEDFDLSPRDQLMQFIERSFPVSQMEEFEDPETGNVLMRVATDSRGNPIQNARAVEMRDRLLDELGSIKVPDGPLEYLLNHFGPDAVAEVTGRKRRVVVREGKRVAEPRGGNANSVETDAFTNGKKRILVFSSAGGTGRSYHAAKNYKNQQHRVHYLLQAGWKAETAVQGLGRTHRTNQVSAPTFRPVSTDIAGHKRFISSIARRLDQLGALTRGERKAGSSGVFSAKDNLESQEARDALIVFYRDLVRDTVEGVSLADFSRQTGLSLIDPASGGMKAETPPITTFLNRLLSLKVDMQEKVFQAFEERLSDVVDAATARGELDVGTETLRADSVEKAEEKVVYTEPRTGVETRYVKLRVGRKVKPLTFERAAKGEGLGGRKPRGFVRNEQSGKLYAVAEAANRTDVKGNVIEQYRMVDERGVAHFTDRSNLNKDRWEKLTEWEAREAWDAAVAALPELTYHDEHLITGVVLPIWDRLKGSKPKIYRVQTDAGERLLGRVVPSSEVKGVLRSLGAELHAPKLSSRDLAAQLESGGVEAVLANDWRIRRRRVSGEWRLELSGVDLYSHRNELENAGLFMERIQYTTRWFVPTGEQAPEALGKLLKNRALADVIEHKGAADEGVSTAGQRFAEAQPKTGTAQGGFLRASSGKPKPQAGGPSGPTFTRPEIEAGFQSDRRPMPKDEAGLLRNIKEAVSTIGKAFSREYHQIPHGARHSPFRETLRLLTVTPDRAANDVGRRLKTVLGSLNDQQREIFDRKMVVDDAQSVLDNYPEGTELPHGMTVEDLVSDKPAIDAAVAADPGVARSVGEVRELWRETRDQLAEALRAIGRDPEFLYKRGDGYMHHLIRDYANERSFEASVGRPRVGPPPKHRSWEKIFKGSEKGIDLDYATVQGVVLTQMMVDTVTAREYKKLLDRDDIAPRLRKEEAKKAKEENREPRKLEDLVPEGYALYQPEAGRVFFTGLHLLDRAAEELMQSGLPAGASDAFRKALMVGGPHKQLVLPEEMVSVLMEQNRRANTREIERVIRGWQEIQRKWKVWQLLNPKRAIKYLTRNIIGDASKGFAGNPGGFTKIPQAARELLEYLGGQEAPGADMRAWLYRGGINATLFQQELSITEQERLRRLVESTEMQGFLRQLKDSPTKLPRKYFGWMRRNAQFLESLMRYAQFLDYRAQLRAGKLKNYGASIREEIDALGEAEDKAYWLSNELIGAYDMVSQAGRILRRNVIPFWSFQELNLRSTWRLWKNAFDNPDAQAAGLKLARFRGLNKVARLAGLTGVQAGRIGLKAGGLLLRVYALEAFLYAFNHLLFPDEEKELPEDVRRSPHIVLGRKANNDVRYFDRLGVFEEFREWIGLSELGPGVFEYLNSRRSPTEMISDTIYQPINKAIGSVGPFSGKILWELTSRRNLFPDVRRPREIEDRLDYLAQSLSLENELRGAKREMLKHKDKMPRWLQNQLVFGGADRNKTYYGSWETALYYLAKPGESAYYDTIADRDRFLKQIGEYSSGSGYSAKTAALRDYKRSLKYGRPDLAELYLALYVARGGTEGGLSKSLKSMDPLYKLNDDEETQFKKWLGPQGRERLKKAQEYYEAVLASSDKVLEEPEVKKLLAGGS